LWQQLCIMPQGVLYTSKTLKLEMKQEYNTSMGRLTVMFTNPSKNPIGNIRAVLGDNPLFWLLPLSPPSGRGLVFGEEEEDDATLAYDLETTRGKRRKSHRSSRHRDRHATHAGTGSAPGLAMAGSAKSLGYESGRSQGASEQDYFIAKGRAKHYGSLCP